MRETSLLVNLSAVGNREEAFLDMARRKRPRAGQYLASRSTSCPVAIQRALMAAEAMD